MQCKFEDHVVTNMELKRELADLRLILHQTQSSKSNNFQDLKSILSHVVLLNAKSEKKMTEIILKGPLDIPIKNSLEPKKKTRAPFKPLENNQNIILEQVSLEPNRQDPSIYAFVDMGKEAMFVQPLDKNPDIDSKPYHNAHLSTGAIPAPRTLPVNPVLQSVLKSEVRHVVQSVDPSINHVMRIPTVNTEIPLSQANAPVRKIFANYRVIDDLFVDQGI